MATYNIILSGTHIVINGIVDDLTGEHNVFVNAINNVLLINDLQGTLLARINTGSDIIKVNGITFSGTASELATLLYGPVYFGGGGSSSYLVAEKILTDAQIKALNTVAVTLVDAPGAGKAIFPQSVYIKLSLPTGDGTKDYGNINAAAQVVMSVGLGPIPIYFLFNESVNATLTNLFSPGAGIINTHAYSGISMSSNAGPVTVGMSGGFHDEDVENTPLVMYMNNSAGALNGGDASNSMKVKIYYSIVNL